MKSSFTGFALSVLVYTGVWYLRSDFGLLDGNFYPYTAGQRTFMEVGVYGSAVLLVLSAIFAMLRKETLAQFIAMFTVMMFGASLFVVFSHGEAMPVPTILVLLVACMSFIGACYCTGMLTGIIKGPIR